MTEDEYYTYPEEEQETPRRKGSGGVFAGLLIGLLIGGVGGYLLGKQPFESADIFGARSSASMVILSNIIFIFGVFIMVLLKRTQRQTTRSTAVDPMIRSRILLIILVLGLVMAGFVGFLFMQGLSP